MAQLYFEKISKYDRQAEPVMVSVPLAEGACTDAGQLIVRDGDAVLPLQKRVLASWPDGSCKWVLLHLQADLPGNADHSLKLEINDSPTVDIEPETGIAVKEDADGLLVDTGVLSFRISNKGFAPVTEVRLEGRSVPLGLTGFEIEAEGELFNTCNAPLELTIEDRGPLCVAVEVKGRHCGGDGECMDFRGRVTAFAGKPWIEVEHQFINTEGAEPLTLEYLRLGTVNSEKLVGRPALGEGYYQTHIKSGDELDMTIDAETVLYQANEHFIDSFYGDFWTAWQGDGGGLAVSLHQAHQNFPKRLAGDTEGLCAELIPAGLPQVIRQGVAKTHRLLLHFLKADTELEDVSTRSLQFQLPDRPSLGREWFRANNTWGMDVFPADLPGRLFRRFNSAFEGRPKALGMLHFGDAPDAGYTDQGRGKGAQVWVNNEYDRPHCCALFYGLTGQRRVLDSALVCARHWLDVDLCHKSEDPMREGGLCIHSAEHVSGGPCPSHSWVNGFLDYYYLTGRNEGLEGARSVAANVMAHCARPEMREPGESAVRENGWALRAMTAMYLATQEEQYLEESERLAALFLDWVADLGGLLAPYTSHSMPRVVFMNSITANSLAQFLLIRDDEKIKKLIVGVADDMLAHCLGPDGLFYYKEFPSLRRPAPTAHALESLMHAWRFTGDRKYLEIATRQFAAMTEGGGPGIWNFRKVAHPDGSVVQGAGGGRGFAASYVEVLLFASAAASLEMLEWYRYPYEDAE